jgi:drug/metabolite transporter (DMT)-like permease
MSLVWGLPYLLIKIAVSELDPSFLVFVRLGTAAVILLAIAAANGSLPRAARQWRRLVAIGTIGVALPFLLIAYGEQHITSSLAALLIAADPLFIVLIAWRFDKSERASGARLFGLILGFVGVAALVGLDAGGDAFGLLGAAMLLGAAVCYGVSALLVKGLKSVPMIASSGSTLGVATAVLSPLALAHLPNSAPSLRVSVSMLVLTLVCTALAYVIYYSLIVEAGATRGSLITYVNPAVAVVLGVIVLNEPLTPGTVLGFALILVGCALSTGAGRMRAPDKELRPRLTG